MNTRPYIARNKTPLLDITKMIISALRHIVGPHRHTPTVWIQLYAHACMCSINKKGYREQGL